MTNVEELSDWGSLRVVGLGLFESWISILFFYLKNLGSKRVEVRSGSKRGEVRSGSKRVEV